MRRVAKLLIIGGVGAALAVAGGVALIARVAPRAARTDGAAGRAAYYCPMHPTYTSDRPGDCPICNMRLVKRGPPAQQAPPQTASQPLRDICYMHHCPMLKSGRHCPMLVVAKVGERVTCPVCGTHVAQAAMTAKPGDAVEEAGTRILYWTDPMIPGYKSGKPGKSPMGMDLVPVYAEGQRAVEAEAIPEGYTPILISPQKQQLIGVKTAPALRRRITKTIRTAGKIAYDPELYQAQEAYLQTLRAHERAKTGSIPEIAEQSARLLESSRMRLRLLGLSEGLVADMATWQGPDRRLLASDPSGDVWVYAPVYEFELPLVKVGQVITIDGPSIPSGTFEGTLRAIDPVLDPETRTVRVRALLRNPDGILKPEMYVNVTIDVALGEVLAVPEEAVFHTGTRQIIFVDKGHGLFEPREVTLGAKAEGVYEVKSGIEAGEVVVTSGNFLIDSESRLKAALDGMAPAETSSPTQSSGDGPPAGGGHQHGG